jgi:hypothetical protein
VSAIFVVRHVGALKILLIFGKHTIHTANIFNTKGYYLASASPFHHLLNQSYQEKILKSEWHSCQA